MLDKTRQNEPDQTAIDTVNLSRIRAAKKDKSSADGSLRSAYAKADMQGLNIKAAKRALKIADGGQDEVEDFLDEVQEIVRQCGLLGIVVERAQLDLFNIIPQSAPESERAEIEGRQCALGGGSESDNRYDANSPKGMKWLDGFRQGASERATVMAMQPPAEAGDADDDGDDD
ncbi:hypothetical protein [Pseudorhodoplanes sp.]|uniref:hypothetical protein n=1 Tax=Pseudorhodoplanes sp. TaxID=1934341 RepID=UPI002B6E69DC|nr:hypothetical protein [Pseudorhodoplanes sp.]HWV44095.1 hypothetical protein [Pseudorhodoplanes sp.]